MDQIRGGYPGGGGGGSEEGLGVQVENLAGGLVGPLGRGLLEFLHGGLVLLHAHLNEVSYPP